jgi:hypothetical protein
MPALDTGIGYRHSMPVSPAKAKASVDCEMAWAAMRPGHSIYNVIAVRGYRVK